NTKLFQLLQTLNVYELNRFGKFLRSPYFNEDELLIQLYELLSPHFKQQTHDLLKQKNIWKALHGRQKFHSVKFARHFSDLLKKLEEFVVTDKLKQSDGGKQHGLLEHLAQNKLGKHYPEAAKQ